MTTSEFAGCFMEHDRKLCRKMAATTSMPVSWMPSYGLAAEQRGSELADTDRPMEQTTTKP